MLLKSVKFPLLIALIFILLTPLVAGNALTDFAEGVGDLITNIEGHRDVYNFIFYLILFIAIFSIGVNKAGVSLGWEAKSKNAMTALAIALGFAAAFGVHAFTKAAGFYILGIGGGRYLLLLAFATIITLLAYVIYKEDGGGKAIPFVVAGGVILLNYLMDFLFGGTVSGTSIPAWYEGLEWIFDLASILGFIYLIPSIFLYFMSQMGIKATQGLGEYKQIREKMKEYFPNTSKPAELDRATKKAENLSEAAESLEDKAENIDKQGKEIQQEIAAIEENSEKNPQETPDQLKELYAKLDEQRNDLSDLASTMEAIANEIRSLNNTPENKAQIEAAVKEGLKEIYEWMSRIEEAMKRSKVAIRKPTSTNVVNINQPPQKALPSGFIPRALLTYEGPLIKEPIKDIIKVVRKTKATYETFDNANEDYEKLVTNTEMWLIRETKFLKNLQIRLGDFIERKIRFTRTRVERREFKEAKRLIAFVRVTDPAKADGMESLNNKLALLVSRGGSIARSIQEGISVKEELENLQKQLQRKDLSDSKRSTLVGIYNLKLQRELPRITEEARKKIRDALKIAEGLIIEVINLK